MPANDHILEGGTDRQPHYYHTRRLTPAITEPYHRTTSVPTHTSNRIPAGPTSVENAVTLQRNNNNGRRGNYQRRGVALARGQQNLDLTSFQSLDTQVPNAPSTVHGFNRGGRSRKWRGRGAPGSRGGAQSGANGGRAFGEQLTIDVNQGTNHNLIEGIRESSRGRSANLRSGPHTGATPRQRASKSDAPDLTTRIHKDIMNGQYECVICTNEVLSNSKIWACEICWSVLHLSCVKRWFSNDASMDQSRSNENEESKPSRNWRCPGCNSPKGALQKIYTCWCSKEIEPRSVAGLPPHSCGQTCAKPRASECPHPCESICHAGPCPPCMRMGPSLPCFCKKATDLKRCVDTKYKVGWSCEEVCEKYLPCQKHKCQRKCHKGPCGSCEFLMKSRCYCGKIIKEIPCSKQTEAKKSYSEGKSWLGSFDCGTECQRKFDCGNPNHFCQKKCHPQEEKPEHCPFSPDLVDLCPCGKTPLSTILQEPRKNCSAPIPHCAKSCQKTLKCEHFCQQICHSGACKSCRKITQISCVCGRVTLETICHQGAEERPHCPRICRATLNCGRHECGHRCCPGEKKASERQASKRKHRALNAPPTSDHSFEPEHICIKVCDRPLKCGNHTCTSLCHKGSCASCLEAVFDEISCACGRTVLHPPQPCGTNAPNCKFDCHRQPRCGHPKVKHSCHQDSEACPKCPFLVEKLCICGKKSLKNQPCWFSEARCGLACGKKLKCGIHFCQKLCHRDGLCEDSSRPCTQLCGRKREVCGHACLNRCHAPYPCKEDEACIAKTFITCPCQNQKQTAKCLSSKTSAGSSDKKLTCNDDCLKAQRKAKLANALKIDPLTHEDGHVPYSSATLNIYTKNQEFAKKYEHDLRAFASDDKKKVLRFKPMPAHHRSFIHSLATDFGLDSESQDAEPHRFVSIFKTPRFVSAPLKTLSQCSQVKPNPIEKVPVAAAMTPLTQGAKLWNAFLLVAPRFGLTIDEIKIALEPEFVKLNFELEISFVPSGDVTLCAVSSQPWSKTDELVLESKTLTITTITKTYDLAASATLCAVDDHLNVLRRQDQSSASPGGWNQVAKRGSHSKRVLQQGVGRSSSFAVLGKAKKERDHKIIEDAPDDWEKEVDGWA